MSTLPRFFGDYIIFHAINVGGMGEIYAALAPDRLFEATGHPAKLRKSGCRILGIDHPSRHAVAAGRSRCL